jgi:hypothetical protein
MGIPSTIRSYQVDPLKTFRFFERTIAVFCMSIPFLLWIADTDKIHLEFRSSVSAYVDMPLSRLFGMLLCIAAMLFIFNGAVYFKKEMQLRLKSQGKWYNVVLGLSLLGVIIIHYQHPGFEWLHYFFAATFFVGNVVVIAFFHKGHDRIPRAALAIITLLALALHFIFHLYSLFWAEWLSLIVIGVHFLLEARDAHKGLRKSSSI